MNHTKYSTTTIDLTRNNNNNIYGSKNNNK